MLLPRFLSSRDAGYTNNQNVKIRGLNWAIFSDKYGIWFPGVRHKWYEKDPNEVTEEEFRQLVSKFNRSLRQFDKIYFYYNPGRFHMIYKRLLKSTKLRTKIRLFTHLNGINKG